MKNLTTTGDISYFTVNGDIYGIDATDGSAVACHDAESPAERIESRELFDALSGGLLVVNIVSSTIDADAETRTWHGEGFDLVQGHSNFKIIERAEV
jgi:hypothetical protein